MKVYYNYLPKQFSNNKAIFRDWEKLIKSSDFTLGKFVKKFEKKFAAYINVKHCISTNTGTDALIIALKSLGIRKNDEVITVCNSFYATTGAIHAVGAKPIFVDSDNRYQIDVNKIEEKINSKTKAILPVHWAGASPEIKKIMQLSKKYNLFVVEDACMGIGASIFNKSPGAFGKVNAFSMHPLKSLNVMGDGGMITTNDDKIAKWIFKYRNHGMVDRNNIDFWGVNSRLQPLQAIVAMHGLKKLKSIIVKRNKNAKILDNNLSKFKNVKIPKRLKNSTETFALYMGLFDKRDELLKYLIKNNIEAKIHYPTPLHLQTAAKKLNYKIGSFPNSEMQAKKLLTLPVHQYLDAKHMHYMIEKIENFYA
ncbi:MAG: hypothetical protein CBC22_03875 [Alphaproteobacteria bacterium TMED62]|nr:MAG: hypothetical protein CBC22_03875 [Alphaproteobacteria bacterium TMED62]|tara:strand:- start:15256 stop:16353 length:1098 start_codon:yes stop_codon:yes gene_type:complete